MANSSDMVPVYLATIFDKADLQPVDANIPFQGFTAPVDTVGVVDSVSTQTASGPFHYGHCKYGAALYGH